MMNKLRRIAGILWMVTGPATLSFIVWQAAQKISIANIKLANATDVTMRIAATAAKANIKLQWGIITGIFFPIVIGLVIFGYYAFKGEYDRD